jgi:hypothetical protein
MMAIHCAMREYGVENFVIFQIDAAKDLAELNRLETFYIKNLNTIAPHGYNLTYGGDSATPSEETKLKISLALSFPTGKIPSEKTRKKMSIAHLGRRHTEEAKRRMSEARIGSTVSTEIRKKISDKLKGQVISKETRRKISEAGLGRVVSEETRRKIGLGHYDKVRITAEDFKKRQAGKTYVGDSCAYGHSYDEINTYISPKGKRLCLICWYERRNKPLPPRLRKSLEVGCVA